LRRICPRNSPFAPFVPRIHWILEDMPGMR
jgi:hypothetical protein